MYFSRDLCLFIYLNVLLLSVLQRVDADCEKDLERMKNIFDYASNKKINEKRRIRTQIRKEQNELNERIESFKLAHPQWEAFKHEPFTSEPYISSEVDLAKKELEQVISIHSYYVCTDLMRRCFDVGVSEIYHINNLQYYYPINKKSKKVNNEDEQDMNSFHLFPCSFRAANGDYISFFYTPIGKGEKQYLALYKRRDNALNDAEVELFAIISANEINLLNPFEY